MQADITSGTTVNDDAREAAIQPLRRSLLRLARVEELMFRGIDTKPVVPLECKPLLDDPSLFDNGSAPTPLLRVTKKNLRLA